jgi:hypothetical protein
VHYPTNVFPSTAKGHRKDYVHSVTTLLEAQAAGATTVLAMIDHALRFGQSPDFKLWTKAANYQNFLRYQAVDGP